MCGITGMWGHADHKQLRQMLEQIKHRGPDGRGMHIDTKSDVLLSISDHGPSVRRSTLV
jgi:asparagine synthase (glutamine-hydrolysing)